MTRRQVLAVPAAALAQQKEHWIGQVIERHDSSVERLLRMQDTNPQSRWRGIFADEYGLHHAGTAAGVFDSFVSAYLHPRSKFHGDRTVVARARLAAELLLREQTPDGNIDNPITNFNSPADTAFVVRGLCPATVMARRQGQQAVVEIIEPFLRKAATGLVRGGIHTPNHRWVVCAALAQLNELWPDAAYVRRIDQWLAEGVDIDADGQFAERSTYVYNPITDSSFTAIAAKLNRPGLLDPVRRNLESMMYLIHPGYEVVTEISRRQDLNQRGDMGSYWFPLAYLAVHDRDGRYGTLARHFASTRASLSALMEYPELAEAGSITAPVPDNYRRVYSHNRFVRVRRGKISATILAGKSRFFTLRSGDAVVNAVRFASAFFGKGQFLGTEWRTQGNSEILEQSLTGPYFQPFDPPRKINADEWDTTRRQRRQSEICRMQQSATITETKNGFRLRLRAEGTRDVPLAVEINFREGGKLEGDSYVAGGDRIRFGPLVSAHKYTQVRGAEPKLDGPTVYLTAFTPFDHTIEFECS